MIDLSLVIGINVEVGCLSCHGGGRVESFKTGYYIPCPRCDGSGTVSKMISIANLAEILRAEVEPSIDCGVSIDRAKPEV
jgi:DnaJ-class molecular chaperone